MEDSRSTLVVLLAMHRSGSSFTTSLLQRLGMSLVPSSLWEPLPVILTATSSRFRSSP